MNIVTDKVKQFQQTFDSINHNPNLDAMQLRINLIQEELDELHEAFLQGDMVEIADAYGDILFLTLGGIIKNGFETNFEQIFDEICESNLSKADDTMADAMKTYTKYVELGVETYFNINPETMKYVTYRKDDGKILKSHNYNKVNLKKFIQ